MFRTNSSFYLSAVPPDLLHYSLSMVTGIRLHLLFSAQLRRTYYRNPGFRLRLIKCYSHRFTLWSFHHPPLAENDNRATSLRPRLNAYNIPLRANTHLSRFFLRHIICDLLYIIRISCVKPKKLLLPFSEITALF